MVTGVSAQRQLSERAVELGAQLVLVHHGLFWNFHPTGLTPLLAERLRPLFKHDINLAAYHLPLDAHPELGNNALLAEALGCDVARAVRRLRRPADRPQRHVPRRDHGAGARERVRARDRTRAAPAGQRTRADPRHRDRLGLRRRRARRGRAEGLDAFLTGEPKEHVMADARESGIHFIAAGHYATETFGVRALGDLLAERFGIEHVFVDIPNPV